MGLAGVVLPQGPFSNLLFQRTEPLPLSRQLLPLDFTAGSQNLAVLGWSTASPPLPTAPAGILGLYWLESPAQPCSSSLGMPCTSSPVAVRDGQSVFCAPGSGCELCIVSLLPGGMVLIRPVLKKKKPQPWVHDLVTEADSVQCKVLCDGFTAQGCLRLCLLLSPPLSQRWWECHCWQPACAGAYTFPRGSDLGSAPWGIGYRWK